MRLDKYLAHCGVGTRSAVRQAILDGQVAVDGVVVRQAQRHIAHEIVTFQGKELTYEPFLYYMMHKPSGVLSASRDRHQPTAVGLLNGVNPLPVHVVGRLDKDTTGLLLLTNNGRLAHRILAPKTKLPKRYEVTVCTPLEDADLHRLEQGVLLDGVLTKPCTVRPLQGAVYEMILIEGRHHQIKRMIQSTGREVVALHRTQIGPIKLDAALTPGSFRVLTKAEVGLLHEQTATPVTSITPGGG
jgi:16S rRNA pseudouridine516 synthase